jgi:hypothetical protein
MCCRQVDDCLAKWQWMRTMLTRVQEAKRQGKPLPQSIDDMERTVGGVPPAAAYALCSNLVMQRGSVLLWPSCAMLLRQ